MTEYQRKRIELELRDFVSRNFEKPSACKNVGQARFYVKELSDKIMALETTPNVVPTWAYSLLAQYNARHDSLLHQEFKSTFH